MYDRAAPMSRGHQAVFKPPPPLAKSRMEQAAYTTWLLQRTYTLLSTPKARRAIRRWWIGGCVEGR